MGREVIKEMNRVGLVVDMSHSAERSTLEAISLSERPIAITHANPNFWHPAKRNKSDKILRVLGESGGMLDFIIPAPFEETNCSLDSFADDRPHRRSDGRLQIGLGLTSVKISQTVLLNGCGSDVGPKH